MPRESATGVWLAVRLGLGALPPSIAAQAIPARQIFAANLLLTIFVDGDGCPVKEEVYKVSDRYQWAVTVVANKPMNLPSSERIRMIVVRSGHLDAADDWIAEHAGKGDIVVTADIPLADRCLKAGARVLGPKGEEFTVDSVGDAMATRELLQTLRQFGDMRGGPAPMDKKDRSRFLGKLDQIIQAIKSGRG